MARTSREWKRINLRWQSKGCKHCGGDLLWEESEVNQDLELKCLQCGRVARKMDGRYKG